MNRIIWIAFLFAAVILSSCGKKADTIYLNGKIYTLDENNSVVEAVAVKEGIIVETGKSDELASKFSNADKVDLKGNVVLPAFTDVEGNLVEFSLNLFRYNLLIDLRTAKNIDQLVSLVAEKIPSYKEGDFVGAYGWNDELIEGPAIIASKLEALTNKYKFYILNIDNTIAWCNSKLMKTLEITPKTPNPKNGVIDRYEDGEPTGFLFDSAVDLIKEKLPKFSESDMKTALESGTRELLKYGITRVFDRNVNQNAIDLLKNLADENKLNISVNIILSQGDEAYNNYLSQGPVKNYKDKIKIATVTLDYDGAFEFKKAILSEPYKDSPTPLPFSDAHTVEKTLREAIDKKFQFTVKVVGDKAISDVLSILENVLREQKPDDYRIIFEYTEFIDQKDIDRMKKLNIIPSIVPEICLYDCLNADNLVSHNITRRLGLWSDILNGTGRIIVGSDFPYQTINPFVGIYYLVTRQLTDTNLVLPHPEQKLSLLNALRSYSIWSAYASYDENQRGSLEKGKIADMIVINKDIFSLPPKELLNTTVIKTIVGGKVLYEVNR
ncbi:MAG: amidohydrolase [Ignavibacteria bacterium]